MTQPRTGGFGLRGHRHTTALVRHTGTLLGACCSKPFHGIIAGPEPLQRHAGKGHTPAATSCQSVVLQSPFLLQVPGSSRLLGLGRRPRFQPDRKRLSPDRKGDRPAYPPKDQVEARAIVAGGALKRHAKRPGCGESSDSTSAEPRLWLAYPAAQNRIRGHLLEHACQIPLTSTPAAGAAARGRVAAAWAWRLMGEIRQLGDDPGWIPEADCQRGQSHTGAKQTT